jgi:hypothetical protein
MAGLSPACQRVFLPSPEAATVFILAVAVAVRKDCHDIANPAATVYVFKMTKSLHEFNS